MIKYIEIPKDGASDNVVLISEAFKKNGDYVNIDDLLFEYETSKAVFEILSEYEGYIYFNKVAGEEINVGTLLIASNIKNTCAKAFSKMFHILRGGLLPVGVGYFRWGSKGLGTAAVGYFRVGYFWVTFIIA